MKKHYIYKGELINANSKSQAICKILSSKGNPIYLRDKDNRDTSFDTEKRIKKLIRMKIEKACERYLYLNDVIFWNESLRKGYNHNFNDEHKSFTDDILFETYLENEIYNKYKNAFSRLDIDTQNKGGYRQVFIELSIDKLNSPKLKKFLSFISRIEKESFDEPLLVNAYVNEKCYNKFKSKFNNLK